MNYSSYQPSPEQTSMDYVSCPVCTSRSIEGLCGHVKHWCRVCGTVIDSDGDVNVPIHAKLNSELIKLIAQIERSTTKTVHLRGMDPDHPDD